jgi:integrase
LDPEREKRALRFPHWRQALRNSTLPKLVCRDYEFAIFRFLRFCRDAYAPVTVAIARQFLEGRPRAGGEREALRWFFRAGWQEERTRGILVTTAARSLTEVGNRLMPPPKASQDLGGADWERDLIKAMRERGFLWRTEKTYREWAARFAGSLVNKSPYASTADDVAGFLSRLATENRASRSTQRQALNALVFFLQEGLHLTVGDIPFRRAEARRRVPTILSVEECGKLFNATEGTPRLMAELMYGAGLRLMELLRLRIHHLDLTRGQLKVFAGKGDKDRVTVLPQKLISPLEAHLVRLREVYGKDRAEKLPGVWLPEGLARKYPKAGESWEWPRRQLR